MDNNEDSELKKRKNIKIVEGDGSNLNISTVYNHLNAGKPKSTENKPKNIIIPEEHKTNEKK